MRLRHAALLLALVAPGIVGAQWTNRYPKNSGYAHHVYLEGYELPIMTPGVLDFAQSSAGDVVIASRGWLWRLDLESGRATRLTSGAGVDSRPAWSPDGRSLAFVRDDSRSLTVILRDYASGREVEVDQGMAMDPVFTADGRALIYANVTSGGDLDLYRYEIAGGARTRLTSDAGVELRPLVAPDGQRIVYTAKTRGGDFVRLRSLADGKESALLSGNIVSQTRPALSPDGKLLAYNWPGTNGWELRLVSTERPGVSTLLAARPGAHPIAPAWSSDGRWVYFSEGDSRQVPRLYRIPAIGGRAEAVAVRTWDYGVPMGKVVIETRCPGCDAAPASRNAARLSVTDANGHPLIPGEGLSRFDGQNGRVYFYTPGTITLDVPAGPVTVRTVRGLSTREVSATVTVRPGEASTASLELTPLWQGRAAGYYSADHHFHLNYGGPLELQPIDLLPLMAGEDLDVATPMIANLHNRFEDQPLFDWRSLGSAPLIHWAQEVRSHFLGHVGLLGTTSMFWPWVWGPGYEVYGRDDRTNAEPIAFGRAQGGAGYYVHPVSGTRNPFSEAGMNGLPVELIADGVHGNIDLLEIVCLWSNSIGTTELWYRLLNAGFPVAPSGGTDVMLDFHRTMAVGTTRVYVRPNGAFNWPNYFSALKDGRSFVTNGPMVQLTVDGMLPGDVIPASRELPFSLSVASAVPVDSVAIVVNGKTVWSGPVPDASGKASYTGKVRVPAGGWVAARVIGPNTTAWPAMGEYTFAHTAPIWIGKKGSTDPVARRAAATDLLRALGANETRLDAGYAGTEIPRLKAYFAEAKATLEGMAR